MGKNGRTPGGFRVPARTARLVFKDELYAGAEVVVKLSVPLGVSLNMNEHAGDEDPKFVIDMLAEYGLENWNLVGEDGEPLALTAEGVRTLPTEFVILILDQWTKQIGEVPGPLPMQSPSGDGSQAELAQTASP